MRQFTSNAPEAPSVLAPCPWCGSTPDRVYAGAFHNFRIVCLRCKLRMDMRHDEDDQTEIIERWNTRAKAR